MLVNKATAQPLQTLLSKALLRKAFERSEKGFSKPKAANWPEEVKRMEAKKKKFSKNINLPKIRHADCSKKGTKNENMGNVWANSLNIACCGKNNNKNERKLTIFH